MAYWADIRKLLFRWETSEEYSHGYFRLSFVPGEICSRKRMDLLIDVFKALRLDGYGSDLKLVLAGGSSETDKYVARRVNQADSREDIIFTDFVTGPEKVELLSNVRLFIFPSDLEGHPIARLEAMAYRISRLVSDISPHSEVVVNGVNGFFFNADNLDDMVSKSREILGNSQLFLTQVAEETRTRVTDNDILR